MAVRGGMDVFDGQKRRLARSLRPRKRLGPLLRVQPMGNGAVHGTSGLALTKQRTVLGTVGSGPFVKEGPERTLENCPQRNVLLGVP